MPPDSVLPIRKPPAWSGAAISPMRAMVDSISFRRLRSIRGATRERIERIVRILDTLESRRAAGASEVSPYAMQLYCGLSKSELTRTMLSAENIGALLYQNPDTAAIGCLSIIRARTRCNQILSDMETAQKRAAQYANYMQANRTARKPNIDLESAA
jgi:hypothetical protein